MRIYASRGKRTAHPRYEPSLDRAPIAIGCAMANVVRAQRLEPHPSATRPTEGVVIEAAAMFRGRAPRDTSPDERECGEILGRGRH